MRTWAKVLLGLGAAAILLVGLAAALLVRSGRWDQARQFAGGMTELTRSARAMEQMQKAQPFTPPAGGVIPEPRLLAYLEVCEALQPYVKPYETWMEAHAGKRGDFKDAADAVGFLGKVTSHAARLLRERAMTPQELAWLHRAVRKAQDEAIGRSAAPDLLDLMAGLRRAVADPGLSPALREELRGKLERQEAKHRAGQAPLSPNAVLCQAYEERIRKSDLKEFSALLLEGMGKDGRPGG